MQINRDYRARTSNFVKKFKADGLIGCREFWTLHESLGGCNHACSYCYLRRILFRYNSRQHQSDHSKQLVYNNYDKMERDVRRWLLKEQSPQVLNTGEMGDLLSIPAHGYEILERLVNLFRSPSTNPNDHKLLFVSKTPATPFLLRYIPSQSIILSFSVNADEITRKYEEGVQPFSRRIIPYLLLKDLGWRLRIRIDPIFPFYPHFENYDQVIKFVNQLQPERVTLGTLRLRPIDKNFIPASIFQLVCNQGDKDRRLRLPIQTRKRIYSHFFDKLSVAEIDVCKETWEMREDLGLGKNFYCNCTI